MTLSLMETYTEAVIKIKSKRYLTSLNGTSPKLMVCSRLFSIQASSTVEGLMRYV